MAEDIKFTEDEMTSLKQLQEDYTTKQEQLEKEYVEVQQREQGLVKTLNDKYGQGQLDPNTGVFTPTK